jgi:hypothetical protein
MSERGIGMEGNFHDRTPLVPDDQDVLESRPEYTKEDFEKDVQEKWDDGAKINEPLWKMMGFKPESLLMNDLINFLPYAGQSRMRNMLLGKSTDMGVMADNENPLIKKRRDFASLVEAKINELGLDFSDVAEESNSQEILKKAKDRLVTLFVALKNENPNSFEEMLPNTKKSSK